MTADQQPRTAAQERFHGAIGAWAVSDQLDEGMHAGYVAKTVMERAEEVATDLGAQIAALRDAVAAPEGLRERIAEAIWDADRGYVTSIPWPPESEFRKGQAYRIADAVLAVLSPAPRVDVDAVMDAVDRYVESRLECWPNSDECCDAIRAMLEGTA